MDPLLSSAASGMRARMESLEMLANNLANASTGGYKSDREFYSIYTAAEAAGPVEEGDSPGADSQPMIEKHWTDYSQGNLRQTGNTMDLALDGAGFFTVNGPSGALYTRNGNFRLNATGVMTTSEGYPLRTADGGTIQTQSSSPLVIDKDGTVRQDAQSLGQLAIANFADQTAVDKQGVNFFMNVNPDLKPELKPGVSTAAVRQGQLEESNVGSAESAVRLVSVMRQFESLQKAISLGSEMNKSAEEVARVTQ